MFKFQAINHGLTNEFLDKIREVGKEFFCLPLMEKQKYSRAISDWDGYGNDTVFSDDQTLDWMDRLYLVVNPEHQRKIKFWPANPLAFRYMLMLVAYLITHDLNISTITFYVCELCREIIHEYTIKLRLMFEQLLKAMARSLNLEESSFHKQHGDEVGMSARFNFYPPCPVPENVLGVKPHADGVTMTFLLQDKEVEGLQVLKDDQWFRVPIVPHAIFVNVGDMLEVTNSYWQIFI